jgi:hypothetical protein
MLSEKLVLFVQAEKVLELAWVYQRRIKFLRKPKMTIFQDGILQEPNQGNSYWFGQDLYTFKAVGEQTGEAYALALLEVVVAPQGGTPPHKGRFFTLRSGMG